MKEKKKQRSAEEAAAAAAAAQGGHAGGGKGKGAAAASATAGEDAEELWARFCKVRGDLVTPLELDFPWITEGSLAHVDGFGAHTAIKLVGFIKGKSVARCGSRYICMCALKSCAVLAVWGGVRGDGERAEAQLLEIASEAGDSSAPSVENAVTGGAKPFASRSTGGTAG